MDNANQYHIFYYIAGDYERGRRHRHRYMLTAKKGKLPGTIDVHYTDADQPGITERAGLLTERTEVVAEALAKAKDKLDTFHPDLEGIVGATGFGDSEGVDEDSPQGAL